MSDFAKNQILTHRTWGEVVALRAWNEHETICLVMRTGRRHCLMNCFLDPIYDKDADGDLCIGVLSPEALEQFEKSFQSTTSAAEGAKEKRQRTGAPPCSANKPLMRKRTAESGPAGQATINTAADNL